MHEIDILMARGRELVGVEVKSATTFSKEAFTTLDRFQDRLKPLARKALVYNGDNLDFEDGRIARNVFDLQTLFTND